MRNILLALALLSAPLAAAPDRPVCAPLEQLQVLRGLLTPEQLEAFRGFSFSPEQAAAFQAVLQDTMSEALQSDDPRAATQELMERLPSVLTAEQWTRLQRMRPTPAQIDTAVDVLQRGEDPPHAPPLNRGPIQVLAEAQGQMQGRLRNDGPQLLLQLLQALSAAAPPQQRPYLEKTRDTLPPLR